MKISIIGLGYVGLVTGICFCEHGHKVTCVEKNQKKISDLNKKKEIIYEPGLKNLLQKHLNRNFTVTDNVKKAILNTDISFIAVGTPFKNGKFNASYLKSAAKDIGLSLKHKKKYHVVVVKSTVLPGTTDTLIKKCIEKYSGKKSGKHFGLSMNPEFLREGEAINDFIKSDRIIIGSDTKKTQLLVKKVYKNFKKVPILMTNNKTAELIKYTSNSLLANLISFSNEISNIGDKIGDINFDQVLKGVSLDRRITTKVNNKLVTPGLVSYLEPGCGFGGSCFPKDVKSLSYLASKLKSDNLILKSILKTNEKQVDKLYKIILKNTPSSKKNILILGLAFKPDTDDIRESPSIKLIKKLLKNNKNMIEVYDPVALNNTKKIFKSKLTYSNNLRKSVLNKDVIVVMTKWKILKNLNNILPKNSKSLIIDPRRFLNSKKFKKYLAFGIS
jgi:UDPglucose 6-dehydrogenase